MLLITYSKVTIRLLSKLKIRCDNECLGCEEVIGLDSLSNLSINCVFNKCKQCGHKFLD